jgi:hypothetical protein
MLDEAREDPGKLPTARLFGGDAGGLPSRPTTSSLPAQGTGLAGPDGPAFVQPSSYLRRPRGLSRPMPPPSKPETAVDKDQRKGLVSVSHIAKHSCLPQSPYQL